MEGVKRGTQSLRGGANDAPKSGRERARVRVRIRRAVAEILLVIIFSILATIFASQEVMQSDMEPYVVWGQLNHEEFGKFFRDYVMAGWDDFRREVLTDAQRKRARLVWLFDHASFHVKWLGAGKKGCRIVRPDIGCVLVGKEVTKFQQPDKGYFFASSGLSCKCFSGLGG